MIEKLRIIKAFFGKLKTLHELRDVQHVKKRQQRLLRKLMRHARRNFAFYAECSSTDFNTWPMIDKTILMREFGIMNSHGLSRDVAWAAAEDGLKASNSSAALGNLTVGTSTGTSGQRGMFIVSAQERALWLGSILARCLPDFPWVKHRVAVMLATGNDLYTTANGSGRLVFAFFDLKQGLEIHARALEKFEPDVLIAPPKAVRALADMKIQLKLKHVFTGGEVLDPLDGAPIETWFGVRPRSIYQATEGFLGVACAQGTIHLNEDDMLFEEEPVAGQANHFVPIITDLRRRAQAMIRYRLNDVLVKRTTPCPCGSPLMALQRIEGRCDDVLSFAAASGKNMVAIMPEALRATILDSDRSIQDFRLVQKTLDQLALKLPSGTSSKAAEKAKVALLTYLKKMQCGVALRIETSFGFEISHADKLRRIKNESCNQNGGEGGI